MRVGVLAAIAGGVGLIVITMPASAFDSGSDPSTYYDEPVAQLNEMRDGLGTFGMGYESVDGFTRRLPDDDFDDQLFKLVNGHREDMGLDPMTQFEPLRQQSAIWSNRLADGTGGLIDNWHRLDAMAICRPLEDIFSVSTNSGGTPEDVFDNWLRYPAVINALRMPGQTWIGIATINSAGSQWSTMRIAEGVCPGSRQPVTLEPSDLPKPKLDLRTAATGVGVRVERRGFTQSSVEIQERQDEHWVVRKQTYTEPGAREWIGTGPGVYRVVVPAQAGYSAAISPPLVVG